MCRKANGKSEELSSVLNGDKSTKCVVRLNNEEVKVNANNVMLLC